MFFLFIKCWFAGTWNGLPTKLKNFFVRGLVLNVTSYLSHTYSLYIYMSGIVYLEFVFFFFIIWKLFQRPRYLLQYLLVWLTALCHISLYNRSEIQPNVCGRDNLFNTFRFKIYNWNVDAFWCNMQFCCDDCITNTVKYIFLLHFMGFHHLIVFVINWMELR